MALETKSAPSGGMDLRGIADLAGLFLGKDSTQTTGGKTTSTNSGGTTNTGTVTESENVSPEAVQALVNSILSGTQGLAATASGQRRAGLYNASTNQMLVNDLVARTAAEGAKLNKSKTQTINTATADNRGTSTTTDNTVKTAQAPQIKPSTAVTGLGALQALSSIGGATGLNKLLFGNIGKLAKSVTGGNAVNAGFTGNPAQEQALSGPDQQDAFATSAASPTVSNIQTATGRVPQISTNVAGNSGASEVVSNEVDLSGLSVNDSFPVMDTTSAVNVDDITFGTDSSVNSDFGGSDVGLDLSGGFDPSAAVDATDLDFDFEGFDADFGDMDLGFAEGGMVEKGRKNLSIRPDAEAAFNSGGDDKTPEKKQVKDEPAKSEEKKPSYGSGNLGAKIINYIKGYAAGGMVSKKSEDYYSRGPLMMANGGMVDITNLGLRVNGPQATSPLGVGSNNQSANNAAVSSFKPKSSAQSVTPVKTQSTQAVAPIAKPKPVRYTDDTQRDAGPATSVPSVVGTPQENQAAMLGMVTMGLSQVGIPSAVTNMGLNSLGLNVSSMNPVTNLVSFLVNSITGASDSPPSSLPGTMDSLDVDGFSQAPVSDNTGLTPDSSMDGFDPSANTDTSGMGGVAPPSNPDANGAGNDGGNSGNDGVGGGGGPASSSAGDGDGASYSHGGDVNGPGGRTDDLVPAWLSPGEFVLNAVATDKVEQAMGKGWLDELNNTFKPSTQELSKGKKVHAAKIARKV